MVCHLLSSTEDQSYFYSVNSLISQLLGDTQMPVNV